MEKNLSNNEALKKMKELIESVNICMYTSLNADNEFNTRPMGTVKVDDDGTIWFFTSDYSGAAHQAAKQMDVALAYAHIPKNTYLSVNGKAELVHDKAKMEELWSPMLKTWFPQGLETPDIALLHITPTNAHYWDNDASRLRILYTFLVGQATGKRGHATEGNEGELDVSNITQGTGN